jgi:sugar phosphate isomerase/epimerase
LIQIGTNPIAWSNDDLPELGGATPLELCLAEAHAAGFTGIESGHKFPPDPAELRRVLARQFAARIHHVHCKDIRLEVMQQAKSGDWSFLNAVIAGVFTVPGDGCIDFPAIFAPLRESGYQGWVVVEAEQDPERANPLHYAKLGYRNLSVMLSQAGFQIG